MINLDGSTTQIAGQINMAMEQYMCTYIPRYIFMWITVSVKSLHKRNMIIFSQQSSSLLIKKLAHHVAKTERSKR